MSENRPGRVTLDFSAIPSDVIDPGAYDATITGIEYRHPEGREYGYLNWEFTLATDPHQGRKLFLTTSLQPNALWNLRDQLVTLGYTLTGEVQFEFDEANQLIEPPIIGRPVNVQTFNEKYQNRDVSKVSHINSAYDAPPTEKSNKKRRID